MSENNHPVVIEMRDVNVAAKRDDSLTVVESVNWSVAAGDFWVVGGQQRSGKSDLLMLAAGLSRPAGGNCRVLGLEPESFTDTQLAERWRIGLVFQGGQLFNNLTIAENVALPLRYQKNHTASDASALVEQLLEMLELTPIADVTPVNIAANWRLRAALARALVLQPELLLLDNPFSGLGARHRQWVLRFLDRLWQGHEWLNSRPMTLVVTTDDLRPWQSAARKFALLHEKTFASVGSWDELATTRHPAARELLAEALDENF
jgi:ABC-type transporter Mla maintaining outer membrane lipid asymmetry ATPase subunit MlaF